MENTGQQPPTREELVAAAALLDQKRQAAVSYLESQRGQTGNTGEDTPRGNTTTREGTPTTVQGARGTPNPLSDILGVMEDTNANGEQGETTTGTPQSNPTMGTQPTDRDKDQAFLLRAARQAMERGARLEAKALLRSLAALFPKPGENDPPNPQQPARVPSHTYCGLPSYYDKNVKAMKGLIPLTIFNPIWQRQAAAHHAERKTVNRATSDKRRYTGLPAPGEWTQSYAQWSRNYQGFINALKNVYKFATFSEWFCIHKDRCDNITRREGFCSGFRYDLAVQANVFQCDLYKSNTLIFADVLEDRPEIATETSAEAKRKKENFNPYTGLEKTAPHLGKAAQESKARGANFQGKQAGGRFEPYSNGGQRKDDTYRGRGNTKGSRYCDPRGDSRDDRDNRERRNESNREPSRQRDNRDWVKGYKSQAGSQRENPRNQNKAA
ncbi:hypothetical protein PCASD_00005 [Puccinia coronata f. sp. avenae]|uniref:Uncharacterized protein n=1 Tax=Puccinia coronata f. sp. avenae TaxID=200324 RepID=A0A2N5VQX6_9BASI|nr:hypothetical protein PCASD_00005 [Puccinia coronata f. sp. avenae]